ncbi:MAG: hypothetical protein GW865_02690 [Candidatus Aenigmarchaeota archaeon]|nr:hypothetical protein [Candidatus Aenigmarchaeota archaeon]
MSGVLDTAVALFVGIIEFSGKRRKYCCARITPMFTHSYVSGISGYKSLRNLAHDVNSDLGSTYKERITYNPEGIVVSGSERGLSPSRLIAFSPQQRNLFESYILEKNQR